MVAIADADALRVWLVKRLEPICDAEPAALAKYVLALLKKEKSEVELKTLCAEQLEVFLQKETLPFVDALFTMLRSNSYVEKPTQSTKEPLNITSTSQESKEKIKEVEKKTNHNNSTTSSTPSTRTRSPEGRRHRDDRRYRRRSPVQDNRKRSGRRNRSRSPLNRHRSSTSPGHRRRMQRRSSPHRSRSPRRRRSHSVDRSRSPSDDGSLSSDDDHHSKEGSAANDRKSKERCWDYDEKGFCMKGDLCPYDHGTDAVVVDDLTMTAVSSEDANSSVAAVKFKAIPIQAPDLITSQPVIHHLPLGMPFPPPPVISPITVPPPMMRARFPLHIDVSVPPPSIRPPISYTAATSVMSTQAKQSINAATASGNFRKRHADAGSGFEVGGKKPFYNSSTSGNVSKTLIVKKIPPLLNNIAKLNDHFAKFGAINNIQVKFSSQPDQALIEFAHASSARAAIRDPGAVLDNRFIRIFWFKSGESQQQASNENVHISVKDRLGVLPKTDQTIVVAPSSGEETKARFIDGTISRTISNKTSSADEESRDHKTTSAQAPIDAEAAEKKVSIEENNEAQKKVLLARQAVREKALQKEKLIHQKKVELHKQRQGLLQKQLEQQKILLIKLDSNKNMPAGEKEQLLKALKILTGSIDSLRNVNLGSIKQKVVKEKQKQAQKDLLDTELDIYNASSNGENVLSLKKRLNRLKYEASSLGIVNAFRGGRGRGGGRARGRGRGNAHRFIRAGANLDRRPCELRISGFHENEKDEVVAHLADFGELETFSFDEDGITCTVKYKIRADAEQAASQGILFKGRNLIIVWAPPASKLSNVIPATSFPVSESGGIGLPLSLNKLRTQSADDDDDDEDISVVVDPVVAYTPPQDDFGYGILDDELDEEALLAGGDVDEEEDLLDEERSWKH